MCKHEKICISCIQEEINQHKAKIAELESKLPNINMIITYTKLPGLSYPIDPYKYSLYSTGNGINSVINQR